ncbi:MAG: hypothetical protein DRJ57_06585 [Thermoprotei archaeon]|nr:MAG: hypothetical protein DRJ57_06585 [Thermoprotei archaeon]
MGCGWRWRHRRGGPGRPPKDRVIGFSIKRVTFVPVDERGVPLPGEPIYLMPDELEALRLVYLEGLTQGEAAERMGVSRGTLWRVLDSGRRKIAQALVEGRPIVIVPPAPG